MLTIEAAQQVIRLDQDLPKRVAVLRLASEINPDFKEPHLVGGYLRDIFLKSPSSDCDVVFEGVCRDQPGVLEAIREAEHRLGTGELSGWEFENTKVTGPTENLYADTIGSHSNHTDFLTLMLVDKNGALKVGSEKTLPYLESRIYDIRYQGLLVWAAFRGRSYFRILAGVATRGIYLCHRLNLNPTQEAQRLFHSLDSHFERLEEFERSSLLAYWHKKTKTIPDIQESLDRYEVLALR